MTQIFLQKWQSSVEDFESKLGSKTGYFYALIANALFAIHDYGIRASSNVPTFQLMFYRAIVIIIMSNAYVKVAKLPIHYKSAAVNKMLISRALIGVLAMFFVFYGFQRADLSEAIALFQIVPVVSAILGVIMLKEKCNSTQGIVIIVSIVGALMILKPNFLNHNNTEDYDANQDYTKFMGNLSVVASAVAFSLSMVLARKMAVQKIDPQVSQCYYGPILCMIVTIGMMVQGMKDIESHEILNIANICTLGYISNFFNMRAIKYADAGKVTLMSYAEIPFGYIMDVVLFEVQLDGWSSLGVLLIFSCLFIQIFKTQIVDLFWKGDKEKKQTES